MDASSFPILSVSIVGILSIALLLLAYYLFLTRCGLLFSWRHNSGGLQHHRIAVVVQEPPPGRFACSGRGLEEAAIRRIPTFRWYPAALLLPEEEEAAANCKAAAAAAASSSECAVCLADFRHGERLRLLPRCRHAFHIDCIDAWLQGATSCPLCRAPAAAALDHQLQLQPATTSHNENYHLLVHVVPRAATEDDRDPAAAAAAGAQQRPARSSRLLPATRRSLSMDSSTDNNKCFYLALQRILQQQQQQQQQQ
jgi:hypothetical protein